MPDIKTTKEERALLRSEFGTMHQRRDEASLRLLDDLDTLGAEVEKLRGLLVDFRDGWDCDTDAHKYKTQCRCCAAAAALEKKP